MLSDIENSLVWLIRAYTVVHSNTNSCLTFSAFIDIETCFISSLLQDNLIREKIVSCISELINTIGINN